MIWLAVSGRIVGHIVYAEPDRVTALIMEACLLDIDRNRSVIIVKSWGCAHRIQVPVHIDDYRERVNTGEFISYLKPYLRELTRVKECAVRRIRGVANRRREVNDETNPGRVCVCVAEVILNIAHNDRHRFSICPGIRWAEDERIQNRIGVFTQFNCSNRTRRCCVVRLSIHDKLNCRAVYPVGVIEGKHNLLPLAGCELTCMRIDKRDQRRLDIGKDNRIDLRYTHRTVALHCTVKVVIPCNYLEVKRCPFGIAHDCITFSDMQHRIVMHIDYPIVCPGEVINRTDSRVDKKHPLVVRTEYPIVDTGLVEAIDDVCSYHKRSERPHRIRQKLGEHRWKRVIIVYVERGCVCCLVSRTKVHRVPDI